MPGSESPKDGRRSSRITVTIPLEIRSQDGSDTRAPATTKYVNKHGGLLLTEQMFPLNSEVTLFIPHLEREAQCTVVWLSADKDKSGFYGLGIELKDAENFWGVQFPPEDWNLAPQAPLAGEQQGSAVSPTEADEQERRTLRIMVNAMVAVLEEKGLLTRGELAETFQRLSRADASSRAQAEDRLRAARSTTL
jgi:hypothetical protein